MEKNLLYFLYGNIDMAKLTTEKLIELSPDPSFKKELLDDLSEYENFSAKTLSFKKPDAEIKNVSSIAEMSTKMSIMIKTLSDKGPTKMSLMLTDGFEMGIKDVNENIAKAEDEKENPEIIKLAQEYRSYLMANMKKYQKYIS